MRRIILFLFALLIALPAICQEEIGYRGCRPGLGQLKHEHFTHRASNLLGRNSISNETFKGDRRQLVVMAQFADYSFLGDSAQTMSQWNKIFNSEYLSEGSFYGSVHDYFVDQSYGQFRLTFDLYYIKVDSIYKYHSTAINDDNTKYLIQDIVPVLKERVEDWAPYDWYGDGYVDQLLVVYAGKSRSDGGSDSTIWAHQWWMSEYVNCEPITITSGGHDYIIDSHCCAPELSGDGDYGSFGTLCHEYSHCFGLPDFYSPTGKVVGNWDVMDNGLFNGSGFIPCSYSAYERAFMGWLTPEELTKEGTVTLPALQTQPVAYLVRNDGNANEYYMIEFRQKAGWDQKLPGSGLVIFHVDYDEQEFTYGWPNSVRRKRYTIFQANDNPDKPQGWAYPNSGNNSLTNTSTPAAELNNANKDSTLFMSKPITEMAVTKTMASLKFMIMETHPDPDPNTDPETGIEAVRYSPFNDAWFTIDGRRIEGMPTEKGLYIHNGRVVLIR